MSEINPLKLQKSGYATYLAAVMPSPIANALRLAHEDITAAEALSAIGNRNDADLA